MFLPEGVGSLVYRARDRLLRELADRREIIVPSLFADMAVPDRAPDDVILVDAPVLETPTDGNGSRRKAEDGAKRLPRKVTA